MKTTKYFVPLLGLLAILFVPPPMAYAADFTISSWDDLQQHLTIAPTIDTAFESGAQRLQLEPGTYELSDDITIDLSNPYFADKASAISAGILSFEHIDQSLSFNGNNHSITITNSEEHPLFGVLYANGLSIENLTINYPGSIQGYAFAREITSRTADQSGLKVANGLINNVHVNVAQDVTPKRVTGKATSSSNFVGSFNGTMASGFAWHLAGINVDDVHIAINGSIGSSTSDGEAPAQSAAYGFTHHFSSVTTAREWNPQAYQRLHVNDDPTVLRDLGRLTNSSITVGGDIAATGKESFATGVGYDMGECWIDNLDLSVAGTVSSTSHDIPSGTAVRSIASGVSDEVMNLTNSHIKVNAISLDVSGSNFGNTSFSGVFALAQANTKGNYLNISHNEISIPNGMTARSSVKLYGTIFQFNNWNSFGTRGVNWLQIYDQNNISVGPINLSGTSDKSVHFYALGEKARTGTDPLDTSARTELPPVELTNTTAQVESLTVSDPAGSVYVSAGLWNLSNAKHNNLTYRSMDITGNTIFYSGLGSLQNNKPERNVHPPLTQDNHLTVGDATFTVNGQNTGESSNVGWIGLLHGTIDPDQVVEHSSVTYGDVHVNASSVPQGKRVSVGGAMVPSEGSRLELSQVYLESLTIDAPNVTTFVGLGADQPRGAISDLSVLVHKDISVTAKSAYGGLMAGYQYPTSRIKNSDVQIMGEVNLNVEGGAWGAFTGYAKGSIVNSTALQMKQYLPFTYTANGATLDKVAVYGKGQPVFGLGLSGSNFNDAIITSSTMLVDAAHAGAPGYLRMGLSEQTSNNFLVAVNNPDDLPGVNRSVYSLSETGSISTSDGQALETAVRGSEPISTARIAKRAFQDTYWNDKVNRYEASYDNVPYLEEASSTLSVFGTNGNIMTSPSSGAISSYTARHAALRDASNDAVADIFGIPVVEAYTVTYDGNGNTSGEAPIDDTAYLNEQKATVLGAQTLAKQGYTFAGWNTAADGSGTSYQAGSTFAVTENVVLYAQWKKVEGGEVIIIPTHPAEPTHPDTPDTPEKPDVPDTPDLPDAPNTPDDPNNPDNLQPFQPDDTIDVVSSHRTAHPGLENGDGTGRVTAATKDEVPLAGLGFIALGTLSVALVMRRAYRMNR